MTEPGDTEGEAEAGERVVQHPDCDQRSLSATQTSLRDHAVSTPLHARPLCPYRSVGQKSIIADVALEISTFAIY